MRYFILLVLLTSLNISAQTTLTEYNYLTKGLKLDVETGRDIKSGYFLTRIDAESSSVNYNSKKTSRAVHLFAFKKESDSSTVALLAEFIRFDTKAKNYICIPDQKSDSDLLKLAENDFYKNNVADENSIKYLHYLWNVLKLLGKAYIN